MVIIYLARYAIKEIYYEIHYICEITEIDVK